MTKTDILLKLIHSIKKRKSKSISLADMCLIIAKSRSQTYKIFNEFTAKTENRPPVFYVENDRIYLTKHFQ